MSTFSRTEGPRTVSITFKVKYLWLVLGVLLALLALTPIVASYYPAPTAGASGGGGASSGATPNCSNPCTIVIQNSQFGTGAPVIVKVGTVVTWKNSDTTDHTSTSNVGVSPAWNTGILIPGKSAAVTFSTVGTFPYHCNIHPMTGEIIVVS